MSLMSHIGSSSKIQAYLYRPIKLSKHSLNKKSYNQQNIVPEELVYMSLTEVNLHLYFLSKSFCHGEQSSQGILHFTLYFCKCFLVRTIVYHLPLAHLHWSKRAHLPLDFRTICPQRWHICPGMKKHICPGKNI